MTTFVLVHGSYQGGWIWQRVATRLRAAGHTCMRRPWMVAPSAGINCARASIHRPMSRKSPTCCSTKICTTSCWSAPVRAAWWSAVRRRGCGTGSHVWCWLMPWRCSTASARVTSSSARPPVPPGLAYAPSREDAEKGLFADLDPATRAWVLDRYTPHPTGCSEIPVKLTDFWDQSWKATVIWCRQAPNPGEAHQRRAAARLGAQMAGTGHRTLSDAQHAG